MQNVPEALQYAPDFSMFNIEITFLNGIFVTFGAPGSLATTVDGI